VENLVQTTRAGSAGHTRNCCLATIRLRHSLASAGVIDPQRSNVWTSQKPSRISSGVIKPTRRFMVEVSIDGNIPQGRTLTSHLSFDLDTALDSED